MSSMTFRKVRSPSQSDDDSIKVELFERDDGCICGWFIGPVRFTPQSVAMPYLARSMGVTASVAVLRAVDAAKDSGLPICIVDPDDLWDKAWRG